MTRRVFFCLTVLLWISTCTSSTSALKILGITTVVSPSHHIWFTSLMNGLARNGHEIYALSFLPTEFDKAAVKENQTTSIVFEGMFENFLKGGGFDPIEWSHRNPMCSSWMLYELCHGLCEAQMATQGAKVALELVRNRKIDIIVQDFTFGQCFYGLREVALENPPLVGFIPFGSPSWIKDIVGGNEWPAIKIYNLSPQIPPFNLWQRTLNLIYHEVDNIMRQYFYMPKQQEIAEKFIGRKMSRSLAEIEKKVNVMLINTYPAFESSTFLPPNAVQVGGLHVEDPKPLPGDIKTFLDGAEHGVVVISLGTNIKTNILGPEKLQAISAALGQLKQRVLWKFDDDHLEDKPKNVMIKNWLPQGDVLAHPKVRVLWSHGGLLSTQEAVWRGVPLIGMPFFGDQFPNIASLVQRGVGLRLDFETLTTKTISETLNKILTDPSFALRMKQLSEEYRDRPMSPLDLAVWHVEYAARHPRGPLASPGRDLSRVQLNLLDVYAILGVAVFLVFWILFRLLKAFFNLFRGQKATKTAQKLKRN